MSPRPHAVSRIAPPLSALLLLAASSAAQVGGANGLTERVSLDAGGQELSGSSQKVAITEDARYVAFETLAAIVPEDTNGDWDIYVKDRQTGDVLPVSATQAGVFGNGPSHNPALSLTGRYVAFETEATNLLPLHGPAYWQVYRKDLQTGALVRVSNAHQSPAAGDENSVRPSISDDGRYVVFDSVAQDLVASDTNGSEDVFLRDVLLDTTTRISEGVWGEANGSSSHASISGDGTRVAYSSLASNLVLNDWNASRDVFVVDIGMNPQLVSRNLAGAPADGYSWDPKISGNGAVVVFTSLAEDLVALDGNATQDVFAVDLATGTVEMASISSYGNRPGNAAEGQVSRDGRIVSFESFMIYAPYAPNDHNVYLRDLETDMTWTATRPTGMGATSTGYSAYGALAQNGAVLAFTSDSNDLVSNDTNGTGDVFVREVIADPYAYGVGSTTAFGCQATLSSDGFPSATNADFFTILGSDMPNRRFGLLFYGFSGQSSNPWGAGTMYVAGSKKRTPVMNTLGSLPAVDDCSGYVGFDMNGFAAGLSGGSPKAELTIVGQRVNVQFWGRDPQGPSGTFLSSALEYMVGP